jgi:SAM-dependent methyltransferase
VPNDEPVDLGEEARRAYQASADRYVERAEKNLWNAHWDRPVIRSLLPPTAGKRVLDAGCAGGANAEWLLEEGASVVAVDIMPRMVELTRKRVGQRADVYLHDLRDPMAFLEDGSIDIVLSSLVLPYVEELPPVFGEFRRVLRPDGCLVLSTHHPLSDWRWFDLPDYYSTGFVEDRWNDGVVHRFWRRTMEGLFEDLFGAGFLLERYLEPLPPKDVLAEFPEEDVPNTPNFLFIRAIVDPRTGDDRSA